MCGPLGLAGKAFQKAGPTIIGGLTGMALGKAFQGEKKPKPASTGG